MNTIYNTFTQERIKRNRDSKISVRLFVRLFITLNAFLILAAVNPLYAIAAPPSYRLQFLGSGSPSAINNNGAVIGTRLDGTNYTPLVSENGAAWTVLPVPVGATSVIPTDINDSDVIVGVSFTNWNPAAVRWTKNKSGSYVVEILPRLAGQTTSYATGINNLGQIVGARSSLGYVPTGTGWLYSDTLGVVDLVSYGFWVYPVAINNSSLIIGGQERLNFNTGQVDVIGAGPSNYNPVGGVAINNDGMIAGTASLRSTSLNVVSVFRYEGAAGWRFIAGSSRYTLTTSINNLGDIGYGELGAGLYLEGLGTFPLGSLLDPLYTQQGWTITGNGAHINDSRAVATVGRNTLTGESGGVLLTVTGNLPPPNAPSNLAGVSHPATRMEPYNSINLTWENTSNLTRGYELQRRETNSPDWTTLALTPPGTMTNHTDTTVGVAINYEYRVRAVGLGGASAWSNSVFVTSPTTPLDTTPPTVTISNPADGANVSGIVPVTALATDNVAVEYLEISFWNQYTGQEVILGSVSNSGSLAVNWDTRALTPATYRLRAFAYDTLGNWTNRDISVNVSTATTLNVLRVSSITLSASNAAITGRVTIRDRNGRTVRGATVFAEWRLPNGSLETATATTNSLGYAYFIRASGSGTFTLRITNAAKTGYSFDATNSVLTKSITR